MADRELHRIDRRIADILEEIRIQRAEFAQWMQQHTAEWRAAHEAGMAEMRENHAESWASREEARASREEARASLEEQFAELRALRETSDLQTAELREVSRTNAIQTDALRVLIDRVAGR